MEFLRRYNATLQKGIHPNDNLWSYTVADLPRREETDSLSLIKSVTLLSGPRTQSIILSFDTAPSSRVTRADPLHLFVLVSFANFRLHFPATKPGERAKPAAAGDTAEYISRLLRAGIALNGTYYHFFGHSNSQLRSRSCFMYAASKSAISTKIEGLGDFSRISSVGKKVKRLGMFFSPAQIALTLDPERVEEIDDIKSREHIFTDGCGLISDKLARQLAKKQHIVYNNTRYCPSVYQIRYLGYKGVLTLAPALSGRILAQFRPSMRKFNDVKDHSLGIVDYSKPYSFGYLNDEVVVLLHALGITTEVLLQKQMDFLNLLQAVSGGHIHSIFQFLSSINRFDLGEKLLLEGIDSISLQLRSLLHREYQRMLTKRKEQRCRIMISKSRLLFGVCDPSKATDATRLKPGTCFVRVTDHETRQAGTLINTDVLVTRNPCLHPGDLQKFRAVDVPQLAHLVDCIVFPTAGKRPSADLMSGGDLDGDKFIVIWDSDIIPRKLSEPAMYPHVEERISLSVVGTDDRADYFARYTNASLGAVKNLHLKWARLKGPLSPECQQLNLLFSMAVDGNIVRVPTTLEDPPETAADAPEFILDILHSAAQEIIEAALGKSAPSLESALLESPVDVIDVLLSRDSVGVAEFDLVQLMLRWCRRNDQDFENYTGFFNFGALTDREHRWLLGELPPSQSAPGIVRNGLLQSNLVLPVELRHFRLDHHGLHWKRVFDSSSDRMARFMDSACRSLALFHKKLIVFRPDERLVIAIYIPTKVPKSNETHVGTTVRVFVLPQSQGADSAQYRVKPTTVHYRLYYDESSFQLYDRKRGNTFIFLTRCPINIDNEKRPPKAITEGPTKYDCRTSIALDKFGRDIQRHVGRVNRSGILAAEIFVITNGDVGSMAVLDQWLHYVDTEEILPLFDRPRKNYFATGSPRIDWGNNMPHMVLEVARNKNLSALQTFSSIDELQQLLELLESFEDSQHLQAVYIELLHLEAEGCPLVIQDGFQRHAICFDLAKLLARFLQTAPYLVPVFFESQTWMRQKEALCETVTVLGPAILKQLVRAANAVHYGIRQSFLLLLQNLPQLSLHNLAGLVELISLTISDAELAIDLLFECLVSEGGRLLAGGAIEMEQMMKHLMGIALNHIDAMSSCNMFRLPLIELKLDGAGNVGHQIARVALRIDAPRTFQVGDHIQIRPSQRPQNACHQPVRVVDAMVVQSDLDAMSIRCLHYLPSYAEACLWEVIKCESFVTPKVMFDAVLTFYSRKTRCCKLYPTLVGLSSNHVMLPPKMQPVKRRATLNSSQNSVLEAVMNSSCTFIWGPPGTGRIRTIVAILEQLQISFRGVRILVAAPTHIAVDSILRAYAAQWSITKTAVAPLRISTRLHKVASDLREYTCDAIAGQEIAGNTGASPEVRHRVRQAQLIFTTCVGAGVNLLRSEKFNIVLLDRASQQTEPESLIPLSKGCQQAIFLGDHAQSRPKIHKHPIIADLDISLFERHYALGHTHGVAKVLLDTQYRMHPDICRFSSSEFYNGKLQSSVLNPDLPSSKFPWPKNRRMVFLQSFAPEDINYPSKSNQGQVNLCQTVYGLLQIPATATRINPVKQTAEPTEVFIVTPYKRQKHMLQSAIPGSMVCTTDEYQGRAADIVIFVSVRCNPHLHIGCLRDKRLLNTVVTGAKAGFILIGDKLTLADTPEGRDDVEGKAMWARLLKSCVHMRL